MTRPQKQIVEPIGATVDEVSAALLRTPYGAKPAHPAPTGVAPKSPLRYPGGKTRAIKELIQYFPPGLDRIASPFIGGGSLEIELAYRGSKVFGYDIFQPLTAFWNILLKDPKGLAEKVRQYYPLTNSKFYSLQKDYWKIKDKEERAAIFFVLNRSSFSGTTLSGGMSPNHPRFTPSAIERLADFKVDNLSVQNMDFHQSMAKHKDDFLYLDPPYAINGDTLYGENGDTHKGFDHEGLAEILRKREGWILSYNDCPKVRQWYKGFRSIIPEWSYGMGNSKKSNEILILSKDFVKL